MSDRSNQDQPTELSNLRINRPRTRSEAKQDQDNKEGFEQKLYPELEDMYLLNQSERAESPEYKPNNIKKKRYDSNKYCKPCKKPFNSKASYLKHQREMHLTQYSESYYCDICTKSFKIKHYHTSELNELNCFICQKEFEELKCLKNHLRYIHNTSWMFSPVSNDKMASPNPVPNSVSNPVPDINDPNLHCSVCDHTFDERPRYHRHLRDIHGIFKPTTSAGFTQLPPLQIIIPDINDPNYYCSACDMAYPSKEIFRAHLIKIHAMVDDKKKETTVNKRKTPPKDLEPEINTETLYCNVCEHTYSVLTSYRTHLFNIHNIAIENNGVRRPISDDDISLNSNDSKQHCHVCNKSYSTKATYKSHLNLVHFIKRSSSASSGTPTNVFEVDTYCNQCRIQFKTGEKHCQHIGLHARKPSRVRAAKNQLPSRYQLPLKFDPNGYCGVCKRTYPIVKKYRHHMKQCHGVVLPYLTKENKAKMLTTSNVESQNPLEEVVDNEEEVVSEEKKVVNEEEKVVNEEERVVNEEEKVANEEPLPLENENQEPVNVYWQPIDAEDLVWQPNEEIKDLEQEAVDSQPTETLIDQGQEPRHSVKRKRSHCIVCQKSFPKQSSYRIHLMVVHRLSWNEFEIVRRKQPSSKRKFTENDSHNTTDLSSHLPNPPTKRMKVNQNRTFQQCSSSVGPSVPL
ncbi:hypothetical protein BD770DRAFT_398694 [Pilaira anomala]|nr:hypothetical protein BD770DRAFT_398694 [Pilaira anomala]